MNFHEALKVAHAGFDAWASKPYNKRWFRKIDGTPIPNDLRVNIAQAFVEALSSEEQSSQSEPQASVGQDALDTISILVARQRELETERDELRELLQAANHSCGDYRNARDDYARFNAANRARANAAETRQRELEEALREVLGDIERAWPGLLHIGSLARAAALLSPPTLEA